MSSCELIQLFKITGLTIIIKAFLSNCTESFIYYKNPSFLTGFIFIFAKSLARVKVQNKIRLFF